MDIIFNGFRLQMDGHAEWADPEGGGDRGSGPPGKSQKYSFFSNTGPDPLENHKATKPAFHDRPSLASQRNAT